MHKTLITLAVLALIGGGVALAATGGNDDILKDPNRADCPGLIECPLTGDMICADECPLNNGEKAEDNATADVPPCCRDK